MEFILEKNLLPPPYPARSCLPKKIALFTVAFLLAVGNFLHAQQPVTDSLESLLWKAEATADRLALLHQLTDVYGESDLEKALAKATEGTELARKTDDEVEAAEFLLQRGEVLLMQSRYDSALVDFDVAIAIFQKNKQPARQAKALERKALTLQNQGMFDRTISANMEALAIWEALGDEAGVANLYVKLSDALFYQERYIEGAEYGERAIAMFKKIGDEEGLANAYQYTADNYLGNEKHEPALAMMDAALEIKQGLNASPLAIASLNNSRANVLKHLERYDEALAGYQASYAVVEQVNHPGGMSATLANIGDVYMRMGRWEEALPVKIRSVEMQEKNGFVANLMENYEHLSTVYKNLGDYRNALDYHEKFAAVRDSIVSVEKDQAASELRTKYETEKKEVLIASQEVQLGQQRTIQWFTFGVAGLLALVLFLVWRGFRQKQRANERFAQANEALEKKNRENELLLKEIHHRVKNNLQTISSLLNLQSASITDASALAAVQESQSRVRSMALIHQKLYQGENLAAVEMKDYFKTMGEAMLETFGRKAEKVALEVQMPELELDVDTAIPLGLITNELLTNSLKYAFPDGRQGKIEVSLTAEGDDGLCFKIADNGVGLSSGKQDDSFGPGTGFGGRLVQLLTMQLGGKMEQQGEGGTATVIRFKSLTKAA